MNKSLFLALSFLLCTGCATNNSNTDSNTEQISPQPQTEPPETPPSTSNQTDTLSKEGAELGEGNALSQAYGLAITQARDEESNQYNPVLTSVEDEYSEYIFPLLQFSPEMAEGYAISVSAMMVQAYGVVAILPVPGQEEAVYQGLEFFIDTQMENFAEYRPDQLLVAQSARLEILSDGTILMVMCSEQDEIFQEICRNLGVS